MKPKTAEWLSIIVGYSSLYYFSTLSWKPKDHTKNSDGQNQN